MNVSVNLMALLAAAILARGSDPKLSEKLFGALRRAAMEECEDIVRKLKGLIVEPHLVDFEFEPEALDAAALCIAKGQSESFVFCDPDIPGPVGYLQVTCDIGGEQVCRYVEVAVEEKAPAGSFMPSKLRLTPAIQNELKILTEQQPSVTSRLDSEGVNFILKDRRLVRQLKMAGNRRIIGVLSRAGLKGRAVLSKICTVDIDAHGCEVSFSLQGGSALMELSTASLAGDALVLSVDEELILCDGDWEKAQPGKFDAKGLKAVAMFRTPRFNGKEETVPAWTPVAGRLKFAGLAKPVFVKLSENTAREAVKRFWWFADVDRIGLRAEAEAAAALKKDGAKNISP